MTQINGRQLGGRQEREGTNRKLLVLTFHYKKCLSVEKKTQGITHYRHDGTNGRRIHSG